MKINTAVLSENTVVIPGEHCGHEIQNLCDLGEHSGHVWRSPRSWSEITAVFTERTAVIKFNTAVLYREDSGDAMRTQRCSQRRQLS